ncbi:MAG: glycine betaine/proline transport system ATP-binding protein [Candidatus Tokpelaia sp. JSC188]|nr:MAG: glycine betaine/proline transport system ATP-binding protein [Candidatus Tokpelaia sp. JSC188]
MVSISIVNVSVIFGKKKDITLNAADRGLSRAQIKAEIGTVLGVHNCTLQIKEGETLVLMGLSGSGKSTLLRTVNGLTKPLRGQVKIDHEDRTFYVNELRPQQLQYLRTNLVSMVFQHVALLPWRSVADNVGLGLEIAGIAKARCRTIIMEQLELVGLEEWADKPIMELSGGMQQRVGLARAFATGAPVLLMDEPFSALDPLIRKRLQDELRVLQRRLKKTIIFVSHDLDETIRMGDRIAIMRDGRIIQSGSPKDIVLTPIDSHVAEFVCHINPLTFLTAADIMRPYTQEAAVKNNLSAMAKAETSLGDLAQAISRMPGNIGVSDKGILVGIVSTEDIVAHIANCKRY